MQGLATVWFRISGSAADFKWGFPRNAGKNLRQLLGSNFPARIGAF